MHIAKSWLAFALAGIALPVLAGTSPAPSPPPSGSDGFNIARLEQIQSETLLLEAQAQRTKAELAAQGGSPQQDSPAASVPDAVPTGNTLPRVTQIAGAGTALSARLQMTDGSQAEVIAGQTLSGSGLTITRITSRRVTARRTDGSVLTLPMAE